MLMFAHLYSTMPDIIEQISVIIVVRKYLLAILQPKKDKFLIYNYMSVPPFI